MIISFRLAYSYIRGDTSSLGGFNADFATTKSLQSTCKVYHPIVIIISYSNNILFKISFMRHNFIRDARAADLKGEAFSTKLSDLAS